MEYLTTNEVAAELQVTAGRVRQLVLEGLLPAEKRGRDLLIKRSDLARVRQRPGRGRPKNKKA